MTLGEVITAYRTAHAMSQRQFALACGVSNGYISMLEKGENPKTGEPITPSLGVLIGIARAMGIPLSALLAQADDIDADLAGVDAGIPAGIPGIYRPQMRKIPLLGKTACGEPIYSPELDDGYALLADDLHADFALQAKGESMSGAGIHDGDIVFFVAQSTVDPGQIAAVFVGEETMLKRVYYSPAEGRLTLVSENPAFPPVTYTGDALDGVRIVGLAVAHMRRL